MNKGVGLDDPPLHTHPGHHSQETDQLSDQLSE